MKKLIIVITGLLLSIVIHAQTYDYPLRNDTLFTANQNATDSAYFKIFRAPLGGTVTFDFSTIDANDAVMKFGDSPDGVILIPDTNYTFTLDLTDSNLEYYTAAGDTGHCKMINKDHWNSRFIGWYFSKGSLTNDTIVIRFTK